MIIIVILVVMLILIKTPFQVRILKLMLKVVNPKKAEKRTKKEKE